MKKNGAYFVMAQIVHKIMGTIEPRVRARDSQKSCVRTEDSQISCARARELRKSCVRTPNSFVQVEGLQILKNLMFLTQSSNQLLRIQYTMTEFLLRQERSQSPVACEPSESENMKHELTHIPSKPWCTSCIKGKAQSEPHKRTERIVEDSELPSVQCDYLVLKDTTASDGLKVLSTYVKSFGYGASTVVETQSATDTFAVTWRAKMLNCFGLSDIILQCGLEPSVIKWAESVKSKRQELTIMRSSTRRTHQSNGAVENYQKQSQGQVRTMLAALQDRTQIQTDN